MAQMQNGGNPRPDIDRFTKALVAHASIQPILECNYLIEDWIGAGTFTVLYGPSGCGKTHVLLDMLLCVAKGTPWRGFRVAGGPVLYVAAEGGIGVNNRLAALKQMAGNETVENFTLLPLPVDLSQLEHVNDFKRAVGRVSPSVIAFDTLARCAGAIDENTSDGMGALIAVVDALRIKFDCGAILVHHTGKDEERGARGHSALKAACDTEIYVTKEHEIRATKQRDMATPQPLFFEIKSHCLGTNSEGKDVTAGYAVPADAPDPKAQKLTTNQRMALDAAIQALSEGGLTMQGGNYHNPCVMFDTVVETALENGLSRATDMKQRKRSARDAVAALINRKILGCHKDHVWMGANAGAYKMQWNQSGGDRGQ